MSLFIKGATPFSCSHFEESDIREVRQTMVTGGRQIIKTYNILCKKTFVFRYHKNF